MTTDPNSHPNAEVMDLLRRTLGLLAGPQKNGGNLAKVEEAHSFTESGIGCEAWDETAARWTITGALARFTIKPLSWRVVPRSPLLPRIYEEITFDGAFRYLLGAAIMEAPQTVNGVNNRGWDAVKSLIELAILMAEQDATVMPTLYLPNDKVMSPDLRKRLEQIIHARSASNLQVPS